MSFSQSLNKFLDCGVSLSRPVSFDLCSTNPSVTVSFGLRHRWAMRDSTSYGRRCDFSANKLTIWMSYTSFCNFNSKSDGRRLDFFSFNYSSSLSTSESRAKTPLAHSFECLFGPQRSLCNHSELFGNTLRALFLKNRDFFWYCEIFLPNTWGPLGCLLGF